MSLAPSRTTVVESPSNQLHSALSSASSLIARWDSDRSARTEGPRLLHNAVVQGEIHKLAEKQHAQADLTAEKVLGALCQIGFADIDLRDVKPADKIQALKILAQHLKLLTEYVHVSTDADFILMVNRVRQKFAAGEMVTVGDLLNDDDDDGGSGKPH